MNAQSSPASPLTVRGLLLRGLAVILPLLLTIVVILWAWATVETYLLRPVENTTRWITLAYYEWNEGILDSVPEESLSEGNGRFSYNGATYTMGPGGKYLPLDVVEVVDSRPEYFGPDAPVLDSAKNYWKRYVMMEVMPRSRVLPVFLIVFLTILYFLGRLFTFGIGRWFLRGFDAAILRIPVISKVYGGVKQVTDFAFSERQIEFNNVVAVQYPSKGLWSIGFVTGGSMRQLADLNDGEQMISVLMPTSPAPMTGFTISIKRKDTYDIDISVDEAIQFVVSCGVVVPPHQRVEGGDESSSGESRGRGKLVGDQVVLTDSAE